MEYFALQFSIALLIIIGPMLAFCWILSEATLQREWQELHKLNGWELPNE